MINISHKDNLKIPCDDSSCYNIKNQREVKEIRHMMTPKFLQLNDLALSQVVHSTLVLLLQAILLEQMLCEREIVTYDASL